MGAHSLEELKNPFQFVAMATVGCFVGHIFMYPLGLFELSGQMGAGIENIFNSVAGIDANSADNSLGAYAESLINDSAASTASSTALTTDPTFIKSGEEGFEQCVIDGGYTDYHGPDLGCHVP